MVIYMYLILQVAVTYAELLNLVLHGWTDAKAIHTRKIK